MSATAVIRQRPPPAIQERSLLGDFDALVERAMAAAEEGREPEAFIAEALRVAGELSRCPSPVGEHQPKRPFDPQTVRLHLARALEALRACAPGKAQLRAQAAKSYVRGCSCPCTRRELSRSGRPVY